MDRPCWFNVLASAGSACKVIPPPFGVPRSLLRPYRRQRDTPHRCRAAISCANRTQYSGDRLLQSQHTMCGRRASQEQGTALIPHRISRGRGRRLRGDSTSRIRYRVARILASQSPQHPLNRPQRPSICDHRRCRPQHAIPQCRRCVHFLRVLLNPCASRMPAIDPTTTVHL